MEGVGPPTWTLPRSRVLALKPHPTGAGGGTVILAVWKTLPHSAGVMGPAKGGVCSLDEAQPHPDLPLLAVLLQSSLSWRGSSVPSVRSHHENLTGWGHLAKLHKRLPHAGSQGAAGRSGLPPPQKEQEEEPQSLRGA